MKNIKYLSSLALASALCLFSGLAPLGAEETVAPASAAPAVAPAAPAAPAPAPAVAPAAPTPATNDAYAKAFNTSTVVPAAPAAVNLVPAYITYPNSLGFQYGEVSGVGLSYQGWKNGFGFQVTAGGYVKKIGEEDYKTNYSDYNLGLEFQHSVIGGALADWFSTQLYLFYGIAHRGYVDDDTPTISGDQPYSYHGQLRGIFGFGVEVIVLQHFSIPFEVGYKANYELGTDRFNGDIIPQIGIRFRF